MALADAAGVSVGWLAKGEGPAPRLRQMDARRVPESPATLPGDVFEAEQFLLLPRRERVAAAGLAADDVALPKPREEYIAFRHDWLSAMFRLPPEDLTLHVAVGESMRPTIDDGDLLLVHIADRTIGFGIYVLEIEGSRLVKRVQRKMDGTVALISDNPAYETDLVPAERADLLSVIGRVIWSGGVL